MSVEELALHEPEEWVASRAGAARRTGPARRTWSTTPPNGLGQVVTPRRGETPEPRDDEAFAIGDRVAAYYHRLIDQMVRPTLAEKLAVDYARQLIKPTLARLVFAKTNGNGR